MCALSIGIRKLEKVTWGTEELGRGSFGTYYAGTLAEYRGPVTRWDGLEVGVKVLHKNPALTLKGGVAFLREVELMTVEHPAVQSLIAWGIRGADYCVVTERMHSDLGRLLARGREFDATGRSIAALRVAPGMAFLHSRGITHRDLKPANVLVGADGRPRITDFGLARIIPAGDQLAMSAGVGTVVYMAPEPLADEHYDKSGDVYAWALILWELITAKPLFYDQPPVRSCFEFAQRVVAGVRPNTDDVKDPRQRELLGRCWSRRIADRPGFASYSRTYRCL
jgi:serine/threonine-protein kinase